MRPDPSLITVQIVPGLTGEADVLVASDQLAPGRGVFSTPRMIELMERAASRALEAYLPEGWTSVGTEVCVRHLAPTLPGAQVTAKAVVTEVKGRRVRFSVEAHTAVRQIGQGTHERALVELARLQAEARRT